MTEKPPKVKGPHEDPKTEEIERLKRDAQQAKDQYLRTLADYENTKKRLQREREEFVKYSAETMVRGLLPIVDSLDQALVAVDPSTPPHPATGCGVAPRPASSDCRGGRDSAPQIEEKSSEVSAGLRKQADVQAVITGVQLIRQQLLKLLEKEGVKRIATVGEPFDPHRHEAIAQVDTTDGTADETVVEEVQVGYTMHGKVIRPAMVKVARKPATSDKQQATSKEQQQQEGHPTGGHNG